MSDIVEFDAMMMNTAENTSENARSSHDAFFADRNWSLVGSFWSNVMTQTVLPPFVVGDMNGYGLTNLKSIYDVGIDEFTSNDPRFKRQTFAIRIGYNGSKYNGYQRQKGMKRV